MLYCQPFLELELFGAFRRISCCLAVARIDCHRRRPGQFLVATGHLYPSPRCRTAAIHQRQRPSQGNHTCCGFL
uniref:Uncharacterized protein n=1 Tax=Arundo donax TaxID=35708 RepID=A0A0A9GAW1_ARUDO